VRPDDPLTVLYTSGTTGPPKRVVITHHNVLYEVAAVDPLTGLPDGLAVISYLPLSFFGVPRVWEKVWSG
jgi:long-chain acyl-CoA synthetase